MSASSFEALAFTSGCKNFLSSRGVDLGIDCLQQDIPKARPRTVFAKPSLLRLFSVARVRDEAA